jgi:hypothetical protein
MNTTQEKPLYRLLHYIGSLLNRRAAREASKRHNDIQAQRAAAGILGLQLMGQDHGNLTLVEKEVVRRVAKGRVWTGNVSSLCLFGL